MNLVNTYDEKYYIIENLEENEYLLRKKAIHKKTGKFVILNILKIDGDKLNHEIKRRFLHYFVFNHRKKHPVILRVKKIYDNYIDQIFLVTSFYKNGNVAIITKEYLETNGQNNEKMNPLIRSKIIFGVASAMKHLHQLNSINRNLTLENIILDDNLEPKIRDNGIYYFYCEKNILNKSNYIYIAPELLDDCNYCTNSVDVYSFAFVIYKMFSNVVTFSDTDDQQLSMSEYLNYIKKGKRPIKPDLMPNYYWDLVTACFSDDSEDRPSFAEIVDFLKFDKFAIEEFGMKTDMEKFREYKKRISLNYY